ncbi:MAG: shikimate dehydrogenase [Paludibacteraceae bacterium]|nr:shikimate dehydrogenase [Paludibacteraceae bacterium]
MRHYGIIGNPLGHSWSARLFNARFENEGIDAEYALHPVTLLNKNTLDTLIRSRRLLGFNVTIPYKQAVIPLLNEVDACAARIGAVNVVKVEWTGDEYRLIGYNTDYIGFRESLLPAVRGMGERHALVLGTGGAARAVAYALSAPWDADGWAAWKVRMVSRQAGDSPYDRLTYNELTEDIVRQSRLIVNCTPLGMYPETDACPAIPYEGIGSGHILYDCIYNPEETLFLRKGRGRGATTLNGKEMLALQARAAWKIWDN